MPPKATDRFTKGALPLLLAAAGASCSIDSAKSRYLLAERLWTDGKYAAAVGEFEKVIGKDPHGKLGSQALHRAAMTQTLYLNQHADAIRKLRMYADMSGDTPDAWEGQKQIGEILFSKTDQYEQAIQHYRSLLKAKPDAVEAAEFLYRIGKSHFFLWQFDEAINTFKELGNKFPGTPLAEKANYEIGVTYYTRGEQNPGGQGTGMAPYQQAMEAFRAFLKRFPQSVWAPEARFGIASCLEELDQLDAAYNEYEALKSTYPSPNVIAIKLARIRERKLQRSR